MSARVSWDIGIPVLLASVIGLVAQAHAVDTLLTGQLLKLSSRQLSVQSSDAAIDLGAGAGSADDPVLHGGSVRVLSIEGDVFDTTYPLPAPGWQYAHHKGVSTGYTFRGMDSIAEVRVRVGKIKIRGRGSLGHTLGGNPAPVRVVLTLGDHQYCMSFGGTVQFKAGSSYRARGAAAPGICPLPYGDDRFWLCRPGMANDQCLVNSLDATVVHPDLSTSLESETGSQNHPYDCFYLYPTVDLSTTPGNHLDVIDPAYVSLTLDPLLAQAARFTTLCRVFAPHYRQTTFSAVSSPNAQQFLDIAYQDVLDAWRLYLRYQNDGHDVVIMGHSQGTFMTSRLMQADVDSSPALRSRLIAALLIGGNVGVPQGELVGGTFQNIPLCTSAAQTGCVIAYHSFAAGFPPTNGANSIGVDPALDVGCTNPAALGGGSAAGAFVATYFPTHTNQPLFSVAPGLAGIPTPFAEYPGFYSGRCVKDSTNHSYLEISATPGPGDLRQDPILYTSIALSPALLGTHILDYSWPMRDLLSLVQTKAAAMP
jgi:hypothetical protein